LRSICRWIFAKILRLGSIAWVLPRLLDFENKKAVQLNLTVLPKIFRRILVPQISDSLFGIFLKRVYF
jgi:hypothetical protein